MSPMTLPRKDRLVLACGVAAAITMLLVLPPRICEDGYLNHVSGSWAALADDWAHGVLYRPLLSELGYGGTRNFPLHIVLHGWLVRAGLSLLTAGHLISLGSACLVVVGGVLGLSSRGTPSRMAWALAMLALASRTAVMGAAGIRGDLMPVAIGVLGLALTPRDSSKSALPAGVILGLAVIAKPTLAWAPAGAFLALLFERRLRAAMILAVVVGATASLGMLAAIWASHGEMLKSFKACASGGGFSLTTLTGALSFVRPGDLAWGLGGVALTLVRGRRALVHPFCAAGLVCLPITLLLLTSRGTHVNHLVDVTVIGALAIGAAVSDIEMRGRGAELVLVVATVLGLAESVLLDGMQMKRGELERAAAALPPGRDPVLSEQPWIPLLAGERDYSIDAFNLLQTRRSFSVVDRDFLARIDACKFRTIVLLGRAEASAGWYDAMQFGPGFGQHVLDHYAFRGVFGAHAFYVPRCNVSVDQLPVVARDQEDTVLERGGRPSGLRIYLNGLLGRRG